MKNKKALLVILDGWGIGKRPEVDAINRADTPFYDQLMTNYPNATLTTFGKQVGLPEGQMGNSEVGHLNIGAGRVVYQELARINKAIEDDTLSAMPALKDAIRYAIENDKPFHLMGLMSDGGVHAHIDHVVALCQILTAAGIPRIYIHAFMDGRDTDPTGGIQFITHLLEQVSENVSLASMCGRYYAMDRDNRWERIKRAYDLLVNGIGVLASDPIEALKKSYESDITDEFVEPTILDREGIIKPHDAVLFFNFRTDRPREIVRALTQNDMEEFQMKKLPLHMVTMVNYDQSFQNINVIYEKDNLQDTLGKIISSNGLSQMRIAETEKYPHVTFFFNGGREEPFEREERIMIPSPSVATYDLAPEMSAFKVTEAICERIASNPPDFICLNYANADMVGHTGDFKAAMKACEVVDTCLKQLVSIALKKEYEIIVIADHGNSDLMINEDGTPHTAHTTNPVPVIYVSNHIDNKKIDDGKLADLAPTILSLMDIEAPKAMTGDRLITIS